MENNEWDWSDSAKEVLRQQMPQIKETLDGLRAKINEEGYKLMVANFPIYATMPKEEVIAIFDKLYTQNISTADIPFIDE